MWRTTYQSWVSMKNDDGDTAEDLVEDKKFLVDLDKNCAEKQNLCEENVNYRSQELAALADTIKVLNDDDDALELFKKKKTLPGASSFVQVQVSSKSMQSRALKIFGALRPFPRHSYHLDFISLAVSGKKIGLRR